MESSFCTCGHEVWWATLNGERRPFIRFTSGYDVAEEEQGPGQLEAVARPVRYCYRLHADICGSQHFTRPRMERMSK